MGAVLQSAQRFLKLGWLNHIKNCVCLILCTFESLVTSIKVTSKSNPYPKLLSFKCVIHYEKCFIYQYINAFSWATRRTPFLYLSHADVKSNFGSGIVLLFNLSYYYCHVPFITLFYAMFTWIIPPSIKTRSLFFLWYCTVFPSNAFL